ncbi:universal stress protein [Vagococcus vulneris]|uniref:Universal stress protein n=1 Tax=Vagococcus vulneris TaxID=1977869 RepID=A0A429ZWJ9_9ENTE|nr:universal stress protein [Vagococcus vulneris]RST98111.1 universal stress protein UspA [Vagococcus vulneris]
MESQEYQSILVGTDGSDQAKLAFKKAIAVAQRNNAKVIVAHILENRMYSGNMAYSTFTPDVVQDEADQAKALLNDYKELATKMGYDNVETILEFGSPKTMMSVELPEKYHTDLIMVGQSGLNAVERLVMGSVSDHIIRTAPCDVLVVRPEE